VKLPLGEFESGSKSLICDRDSIFVPAHFSRILFGERRSSGGRNHALASGASEGSRRRDPELVIAPSSIYSR